MIESIVSPDWLNEHINNPEVIVLDCSPQSNQAGMKSDFNDIQIEGSRYFDLQKVFSDTSSSLPNMLPAPEQFEIGCKRLGINNSSIIVLYDNLGTYASPRVWWMFRIMGHRHVAVLNGGLPEWVRRNYKTTNKEEKEYQTGDFKANFNKNMVSDLNAIKLNLKREQALIIDARPENRFKGIAPEPREGLRSGNIPKSINIPFQEVLENGKFKHKDQLDLVFKDLKDDSRALIFSCGSGMTACIVLLASEIVLRNEKSVYDGSWAEWGSHAPD